MHVSFEKILHQILQSNHTTAIFNTTLVLSFGLTPTTEYCEAKGENVKSSSCRFGGNGPLTNSRVEQHENMKQFMRSTFCRVCEELIKSVMSVITRLN